jgi:anti-sigma regulatory factor (Ser/Thr protein kinase)
MEVTPSVVPISDRSAVGEVRRRAQALAMAAGFGEEGAGRVAIVATELASNVAKHGAGGHCFLSLVGDTGDALVQIVAVDSGHGIDEPSRALQDGYSTAGTPGTGLGAVQRLSRSFDLFSHSGSGTVVVARVASDRFPRTPNPRPRALIEVGAVEAPLRGEPVSGDAWALERDGATTRLLVTDGLGHGPFAAEASRAATSAFQHFAGRPPARRVELIHEAMRGTRGAAMAVAEIDPASRSVRYAGIGNIAAQIVAGTSVRSLVSMNGTAGHQARTIREFSYGFPPGALLVVHSDGVSARWTLDRYPGITLRDPAVIATLLHRDHGRGRDDAIVVVARHNPQPAGPGDRTGS